MKKKIQILHVHGGMTFRNKKDYMHFLKTRDIPIEKPLRWFNEYLDEKLGRITEIIRPRMPCQEYAHYAEWKIYFERYIPYLRNSLILIGSSLGGIFLAKYLSEHAFPKKILAAYLVCPPFDDVLPGEDLVGGFTLQSSLSLFQKNAPHLTLLFSQDDDVVPVSHARKYAKALPHVKIVIYKSKNGHFKITKFPEIVRMIRKDIIRMREVS